jgi:lipopolysaccharide transport system permease protein
VPAWRDLTVRCKQTAIEPSWAVNPALSRDASFHGDFSAAGPNSLLREQRRTAHGFFRRATMDILLNRPIRSVEHPTQQPKPHRQAYFPRMIVPITTVVVAFADFLVSLAILITD